MVCEVPLSHDTPQLFDTPENAPEETLEDIVDEGHFPYWTLAQPLVYKLRTCCVQDFVPTLPPLNTAAFNSRVGAILEPIYKTRMLELPDTGVAYLFRGKKYLLIENVERPHQRYVEEPPAETQSEDVMRESITVPAAHKLTKHSSTLSFTFENLKTTEDKPVDRAPGLYELTEVDFRDEESVPNEATVFLFSFSPKQKAITIPTFCPLSHTTETNLSQQNLFGSDTGLAPGFAQQTTPRKNVVIPCECQLIKMRQVVHRELFSWHVKKYLSYIQSVIGKKESESAKKVEKILSLEVSPLGMPKLESTTSLASINPEEGGSAIPRIVQQLDEQHAQDIINELAEMFYLLKLYKKD
jgi:hypothetical protein